MIAALARAWRLRGSEHQHIPGTPASSSRPQCLAPPLTCPWATVLLHCLIGWTWKWKRSSTCRLEGTSPTMTLMLPHLGRHLRQPWMNAAHPQCLLCSTQWTDRTCSDLCANDQHTAPQLRGTAAEARLPRLWSPKCCEPPRQHPLSAGLCHHPSLATFASPTGDKGSSAKTAARSPISWSKATSHSFLIGNPFMPRLAANSSFASSSSDGSEPSTSKHSLSHVVSRYSSRMNWRHSCWCLRLAGRMSALTNCAPP